MGQGLPFESVHRTILGSLSLLGLVILNGVHITILIQYLKTLFHHLGFALILFQTSKILMNFTIIHFLGFGSLRSRHNFCGFCSISLQSNQTQHLFYFFTTNYPNKRYCFFDRVNTKPYLIEVLTWLPCCFIPHWDVD